jgi:hypothetical protein
LLDIWQRSKTFPDDFLSEYRQKLSEGSTTPVGTPPPPPPTSLSNGIISGNIYPNYSVETTTTNGPANPPDAASILSALAAMAKTAPVTSPPIGAGSFANSINPADPRVRNVKSPLRPIITPAPVPIQPQAAPAANPLAAFAALFPQAATYSHPPTILIPDNLQHQQ